VPQETAPVEVYLGWGVALLAAGLVLCFTGGLRERGRAPVR
jgi:hypothetical protein